MTDLIRSVIRQGEATETLLKGTMPELVEVFVENFDHCRCLFIQTIGCMWVCVSLRFTSTMVALATKWHNTKVSTN